MTTYNTAKANEGLADALQTMAERKQKWMDAYRQSKALPDGHPDKPAASDRTMRAYDLYAGACMDVAAVVRVLHEAGYRMHKDGDR